MNNMVKIMAVAFATVVSVAAHADAKWDEGAPRIKGPKVYGATPGRTFLYTFPTCGSRKVLAFFNLDDDKEWNISHSLGGAFVVRDVLEKADLGKRDSVTATLPIHAAKVYTIGNVEVK